MNRPINPVDQASLRRLSRAAIALKSAPIRDSAMEATALISAAIEQELKVPFTCTPRVTESRSLVGDLPAGCCYLVFLLTAEGRRALLELEAGFAAALVDRLAGGVDCAFAPQAPSPAEIAALSFLALHAVRAARSSEVLETALSPRFLGLAPAPDEVVSTLASERSWVACELSLAAGAVQGHGRLLLPGPTACRLARLPHGKPHHDLFPGLGRANLPAMLVCTAAELSEGELALLGEGDALLLSSLKRSEAGISGDARLILDDFQLLGRLDGSNFSLASVADALRPEALMHDTPTLVSSLPIEVQVELARVKLPLSRLDQLQAGSVLELGTTLADTVVLRIGDRAVAHAELVDVDGELAARIVTLLP